GEGLWLSQGETSSYYKRPEVSADGAFVFLWNDIFDAADGTLMAFEYPSKIDRFLAGNDGKTYFRTGHNLVEWQWVNGTPEILQDTSWSYPMSEETLPQEAAVTKNHVSWELYTSEGGGSTSVFWVEVVEEEGQQLGAAGANVSLGTVVFMDDETLFTVLCGFGNYRFPDTSSPKPQCNGIRPLGEEEAEEHEEAGEENLWSIQLEKTGNFIGAAYHPETEMLYMTTQEGILYAVDITPTPAVEISQAGGESTPFDLPTTPVEITDPVVAWEYRPDGGLVGGPVAALDGIIYVATIGGKVVALQQDGALIWETMLDPAPGAGPELSPNGPLFIPDASGGLVALDGQGNILWHFTQPIPGLKPASKPVITANGIIAYSITDNYFGYVQAVSTTGEGVWLSDTATTAKFYQPPRVSAAGDLVFLAENVFDTGDGRLLTLSSPQDVPIEPDEFITGLNGKNYILVGNTLFEWQRNGDQIEILTTIEWDFRAENAENPTFSISSPAQIEIGPDGTITLWYRYNVLWLSETGETLALANTTANHTIASVLYNDATNTFTCGIVLGGPTDPSSEQCMGFTLGSEKPDWKIDFGTSSQVLENVLGGARIPAGFVFASRKGVLYGVMEKSIAEAWEVSKSQPAPPAETGGNGAISNGSGWVYKAPESLIGNPIVGQDEMVYLLGESQTMYVLSSDGGLRASFPLPTNVYVFQNTGFGGSFAYLMPSVMEDGNALVVSDNRVYALNLDGSQRWEFPITRPPYSSPIPDDVRGVWFLIDNLGTLYAFSPTDGLLWTHDLAEGLKAASPWPVFGPNGEIYYTITNGTKGMIEALNPDGSPIQRIDLSTFSFFRPIEITPDGVWLVVDDNVVNTTSGRLVEADNLEFHIEEFAMGHDGRKYLVAGSSVIEWEVGANGLQIVNQVAVTFPENRQAGIPPSLSVSKDSVYWIRLFAAFGSRWINLWVNPQGEVLGLVNVDTNQELILNVDEETNSLSVCNPNRDENQLECRGYENGIGTPAWELTIEGLGRVSDLFYLNGRLYVQVDEDTVQVVEVALP
ncbi:MAG TPA: PQQ-binding-like beta-propeller repeat protein, partial [Anaerolineales bacterium]|nr:PQQ-binding-like beta-propeller repeat protein [Anaerolineales bacterium]